MSYKQTIFDKSLNESQTHFDTMYEAYIDMQSIYPLDQTKIKNLSKDQKRLIDQFLFRFIKLQDTMGNKLFRNTLKILAEDIDKMSFIDILHKLEKLEFLDSAKEWIMLRDLRNDLAHEYDENSQKLAEFINKIYLSTDRFKSILQKFHQLKGKEL